MYMHVHEVYVCMGLTHCGREPQLAAAGQSVSQPVNQSRLTAVESLGEQPLGDEVG